MRQAKKIALLGFDCALTALVRQHITEGICPNFKKIFENGTVAENCLVPYPTITPPNWTVMATGAWPGTNGITDFWRHIPGTTPENKNTHNSFNWDWVQSESFWESAEKAGKKSVILNYPMSYNVHKKLKHGVVVGGASLTPGVFMDQEFIREYKGRDRDYNPAAETSFCDDMLISTEKMAGNNIVVKFEKAQAWTNVDNFGDKALEAEVDVKFFNSIFNNTLTGSTWYLLVRDLGDGYDTLTLSPSKNFKEAFFTIKPGEWSKPFKALGVMENGSFKEIRPMAKLVSMNDEAEDLKLYVSAGINMDGELWCFPQEKATLLNKGDNVPTNNTGMGGLGLGWYDLATWLEIIGIHYDWMGDTAEALLGDPTNWDIFYTHAHPTDYIYHVLMTELDPETCSSKQAHDYAWEMHRRLYVHADRYLGRLLELLDDDTLVVLTSDHGATPDGPNVDMMDLFSNAGMTAVTKIHNPDLDAMSENLRNIFAAFSVKVDASKSIAIPQRCCFVYVNLKGRDPEGIVEPEDFEKVQRQIIDLLVEYKDENGKHPFCLVLPKRDAMLLGQWGDQCGDVVYALWPEYTAQHGSILPTAQFGSLGDLRTLQVYYGPKLGIKQGFSMERVCNIVDLVPTFCYMTGWPLPKTVEGSVVYQIMEDPDFRAKQEVN